MDDVYGLLVTVDYPEALTGGLRRTTDALRAVLERTRGDVTNRARDAPGCRRDRDGSAAGGTSVPRVTWLAPRGCSSAR